MQTPPDYIMTTIESMVVEIKAEFPKLNDKEVELSYTQLRTYYQKVARKKTKVEEPLAGSKGSFSNASRPYNSIALKGFDQSIS